jgi:hypothetical protein
MPTKTYTRVVETLFTREEMKTLLEEAHKHCKDAIKMTLHKIGKKRPRSVIMRKRDDYLDCIKKFIHGKIAERAKEKGVKVEIPLETGAK